MNRDQLLTEYFRLSRDVLPQRAVRERWVVKYDHCFQRIVLDHVCGAAWKTVLTQKKPAYQQLSDEQLQAAVTLCRKIDVQGDELLRRLNEQSLKWRGKISDARTETA